MSYLRHLGFRFALFAPLCFIQLSWVNSVVAAQLPQDHHWQVVLRAYLATLQPDDFAIERHEFVLPDEYLQASDDRVYRDWIVLGHLGREPSRMPLHAEPEEFTLARIEGDTVASH